MENAKKQQILPTVFPLGELLITQGTITQADLMQALVLQQKESIRLGEALVKLGAVTEMDLAKALAEQAQVPFVSKENGGLDAAKIHGGRTLLIPEDMVRKHWVLPLSLDNGILTVAMADPSDVMLLDNLRLLTGAEIQPAVAPLSELRELVERGFPEQNKNTSLFQAGDTLEIAVESEESESNKGSDIGRAIQEARTDKVVHLVNLILKEAVTLGASDIHLESYEHINRVRFRIDGILTEQAAPPHTHFLAVLSRFKILSHLDIAERRLPQDGGFTVNLGEHKIDLRVSTMPTVYGEKMVLRLLDKKGLNYDLKSLGFSLPQQQEILKAVNEPHGLIFVTGPTGSGKSTTLYALLQKIHTPSKNIVTIEDPVEYKIEGINQVQIKPAIGLTFASGLRSFLRQDPDVMMVGEVRDQETAQICTRAALTGHLVLSTLHTNDAISAIYRLMDLGVEPFLLMPSLIMVAAQRLVRLLCTHCKEAYKPEAEALKRLGFKADQLPAVLYRARGCTDCRKTGYRGRQGIYEIVSVTDAIRQAIFQQKSLQELRAMTRAQGYLSLRQSGFEKAIEGVTSLEEVLEATTEESQ